MTDPHLHLVTGGAIWLLFVGSVLTSRRTILRLPAFPEKRKLLRGGIHALCAVSLVVGLLLAWDLRPERQAGTLQPLEGAVLIGMWLAGIYALVAMTRKLGAPATMAWAVWHKAPEEKRGTAIQEYAAEWERWSSKGSAIAFIVTIGAFPLVPLVYFLIRLARLGP